MILVGAILAVAALPAAAAQDGGAAVAGEVPSFLQLSLTQPDGFASFPARNGVHDYQLTISAQVTATDSPILMTIGDGDSASGASHGHLVSGSFVLPAPLQVTVGSAAFRRLDAPVDPLLAQWRLPITQAPAPIRLRQQVAGGDHRSGYHKLLLLTVSTQSP